MTEHLGRLTRDLLAAPLQVPQGVDRLGRALWLYVRLVSITNSSGHICRTLGSLGQDLGVQLRAITPIEGASITLSDGFPISVSRRV